MNKTLSVKNEHTKILRHMLGIDIVGVKNPKEYRDYYCANPGNAILHEMESLYLVKMYSERDGYQWFTTTDLGKAIAKESQRKIMLPKKKRMYLRFLNVADCCPDLTFREFLMDDDYADIRKSV